MIHRPKRKIVSEAIFRALEITLFGKEIPVLTDDDPHY